jgi:uncharacterized protein (TIGR02118 family)
MTGLVICSKPGDLPAKDLPLRSHILAYTPNDNLLSIITFPTTLTSSRRNRHKMTCLVSFFHPSTSSPFDIEYYLKSHMPLVERRWRKYGLITWQVCTFDPAQSPYRVHAALMFENASAFEKAVREDSKEIIDDVTRFSADMPLRVVGQVVAGQSIQRDSASEGSGFGE